MMMMMGDDDDDGDDDDGDDDVVDDDGDDDDDDVLPVVVAVRGKAQPRLLPYVYIIFNEKTIWYIICVFFTLLKISIYIYIHYKIILKILIDYQKLINYYLIIFI